MDEADIRECEQISERLIDWLSDAVREDPQKMALVLHTILKAYVWAVQDARILKHEVVTGPLHVLFDRTSHTMSEARAARDVARRARREARDARAVVQVSRVRRIVG
jgi:hypothetical protein